MAKILTEYLYLDELMTRWGCNINLISTLRHYAKDRRMVLQLWIVHGDEDRTEERPHIIVDLLQAAIEDTPHDTLRRAVADIANVRAVEEHNEALKAGGTDYIIVRDCAVNKSWWPAEAVIRLFPEDRETKRLLADGSIVAAVDYHLSGSAISFVAAGHGVLSTIINMRNAGKEEEDIAGFLKESGLSKNQIGALLHPDPLHVGQDAIASHAQRLIKKYKEKQTDKESAPPCTK